jgi:hypothetical protein
LLFSAQETFAQSKKKEKQKRPAKVEIQRADAKRTKAEAKKVIDSTAVTQRGLIDVHKLDNKYLFEIPDSILGSEMMTTTVILKLLPVEESLVVKKPTDK